MEIINLPLSHAALIQTSPISDHRGCFARLFCMEELGPVIGARHIVNVNHSYTANKGVLRGLHFQRAPHQEMKFVRCTQGAVYDVIVDIRRDSSTYLQWHAEVLSAENMRMLCVPEGFAHGFQSLEDRCEVIYLTTAYYNNEAEGGLRHNDPAIGIRWPLEVTDISVKDASHPYVKHQNR